MRSHQARAGLLKLLLGVAGLPVQSGSGAARQVGRGRAQAS